MLFGEGTINQRLGRILEESLGPKLPSRLMSHFSGAGGPELGPGSQKMEDFIVNSIVCLNQRISLEIESPPVK